MQGSTKEIEFIAVERSRMLDNILSKLSTHGVARIVSPDELKQFILNHSKASTDMAKMPVRNLIIEHYLSSGEWSILVIDGRIPLQLKSLPKTPGFRGVVDLSSPNR